MFKSKTTIVLGAGASAEANLPTGGQLIPIIRSLVSFRFEFGRLIGGDGHIWETINRHCRENGIDPNIYARGGNFIHEGLLFANSIDDFMDSHHSNEGVQLVGKLAILKSILEAERRSKLYFDPHQRQKPNLDSIGENWLLPFMRVLRQGVAIEDVSRLFDNITFVSFNYDRCLEHFLHYAIAAFFKGHQSPVDVAFEGFKILYPYGSVGPLPERRKPNVRSVEFGSVDLTIERAHGIRTYAEQFDSSSEIDAIHKAIEETETLIFLGFAFHEPNMRLLTKGKTKIRNVFATVQGVSSPDITVIERQVRNLCQSSVLTPINFLNGSCFSLFSEYQRSIAA
ncbi:MAG: hypothetical protein KF748_13950 [Xanthobacteraceae bacterium]|nr:hypothetical protein [Xanthobacteraceae bacterium]